MSKMSKVVKEQREDVATKRVENFMGGYSYEINPLDTLKMVTSSSIFGEPQYYRDGEFAKSGLKRDCESIYKVNPLFAKYSVLPESFSSKTTTEIMETAIDAALEYDFKGTLEWAKVLRKEYYMRLNPQVIMVRAAINPARQAFTEANPGMFTKINKEVMFRADDVISQITYYLYKMGSKNKIPGILKKSWADRINSMSNYELYKYKNHGIGLVDAVRISHAHSTGVDELMKTGTVVVEENNTTWENLKASGKSWVEILDTIKLGHMALLRNLRGIFTETDDRELCKKLMEELKAGVEKGKQFPFRYMSAQRAVQGGKDGKTVNNVALISDTLEDCMDIACNNLPKLKGKSAFLSDNSGSAWGTFNSEFGSVTIGDIDNLSAVIGAVNSEEGYVFPFGDRLLKYDISKRQGILGQARKISKEAQAKCGGATENGIWLFLKDAIDNKVHWDNIFIYSDMQAGHGGLYGYGKDEDEYCRRGFATRGRYVDVAKLIAEYRNKVNPKVNVFCIQTAGYNNVLVPEYGYRTNILYGWTGKELLFADSMIKFWDEKDAQKQSSKN